MAMPEYQPRISAQWTYFKLLCYFIKYILPWKHDKINNYYHNKYIYRRITYFTKTILFLQNKSSIIGSSFSLFFKGSISKFQYGIYNSLFFWLGSKLPPFYSYRMFLYVVYTVTYTTSPLLADNQISYIFILVTVITL